MFWNEAARRWMPHPQCRCDREPCICCWLDPLDAQGRPITDTIIAEMRQALAEKQRKKDAA